MPEASIPVDLLNPGQVFACLGLLELADKLLGNAEGAFDWTNEGDTSFRIRASGDESPVVRATTFLRNAVVTSRTPTDIPNGSWIATWGEKPTLIDPIRDSFPFPAPDSPAALPATLSDGIHQVDLIHWGYDMKACGRDDVKFWAGSRGYPGSALARDALALIKEMPVEIVADPFNAPARQSSSFRFDWRRDYVPLDIGFSLNAHSSDRFCTIGYPIVELLAVIGLTNARPKRISKLEYRYSVVSTDDGAQLLDPPFHRAALGTGPLPFRQRIFKMNLGWPGQEDKAKCITTVEELSFS
jgi:CRISPR-associated protein Csb3